MAEGFNYPTSNVLCRYYVHGACRLGASCRFSHNRGNAMSYVCKYYLMGCCSYGDQCRYDHVKPKPSEKPIAKADREPLQKPAILALDEEKSNMVSLKKVLRGDPNVPKHTGLPKSPEEWVKASEFVPGQPYQCTSIPSSYAHAAHTGVEDSDEKVTEEIGVVSSTSQLLCPYSVNKECPYGTDCEYIHGDICELCGAAVLMPGDEDQQNTHKKECLHQHEKDMEVSFAVARSKEKQCSICMDIVYDKEPPTERRFGIMSDCCHCFCLACIRKWRSSKQFDSKTIRSCPECRVQSDFVTPSKYWVDTKEEKIKLIEGYKYALSKKKCKYFDEGRGECPFNDKCFYLHAYPDGRLASPKPRRRRRCQNAEGDLDLMDSILWDFLQERDDRVTQRLLLLELLEDDLTDLISTFDYSSSDVSDDSLDESWF